PYRDRKEVLGYFFSTTDAAFAAFLAGPRIDPRVRGGEEQTLFYYSVVCHEYTHFVLDNNFANVPPWLHEGLAQYFATFRMDGDVAECGFPIKDLLRELANVPWVPLELLVQGAHPTGKISEPMFYAESWGLVHYMLNGNVARRRQLDTYMDLLEKGIPSPAAFATAFGTDPKAFGHELAAYVQRNQFYKSSVSMADVRNTI